MTIKRKRSVTPPPLDVATGPPLPPVTDPLEFLRQCMSDPQLPKRERMRAAVTLAQYTSTRTKDGGKKEAKVEAAAAASTGKFAPAPPPLRIVKSG